eukprot:758573-Hanusia_phi.AAC.7
MYGGSSGGRDAVMESGIGKCEEDGDDDDDDDEDDEHDEDDEDKYIGYDEYIGGDEYEGDDEYNGIDGNTIRMMYICWGGCNYTSEGDER